MPEHIGVGMYNDVVRRGTRALLRKQRGNTRDQVLLCLCVTFVEHCCVPHSPDRTHPCPWQYFSHDGKEVTWSDWLSGGLRFAEVTSATPSASFAKAMAKKAEGGEHTNKGDDSVNVNVFLLHEDKQVTISVTPFARVSRVKTAIERAHGLKQNQQTLVYRSLPHRHVHCISFEPSATGLLNLTNMRTMQRSKAGRSRHDFAAQHAHRHGKDCCATGAEKG